MIYGYYQSNNETKRELKGLKIFYSKFPPNKFCKILRKKKKFNFALNLRSPKDKKIREGKIIKYLY